MKKVKVGKIDIAYQWDGLEDGPVLMMAHAMGTSYRIWDQQIGALQAQYKILRYDWRGHGSTSAPDGPYTLEEFVDDAIGTMNALCIQTVNWVGISTGGMIGQGLAIRCPERISSLVLCNTTSQSDVWYKNWVKERQAVVKDGGMPPVWEMTKALWFNDDFVARENADYCRIRDVFVKTPVAGYLGGTSAVADLAYRDKLHLIQAPTRIIAAGDDPVTPIQKSKEIQSEISNSELVIIDGQRHFSNVEVPETFNNELIRCLDQII